MASSARENVVPVGTVAVMPVVEKTGVMSFPGLWKAAARDAEGTGTFIYQTRLYPDNL